MRKFGKQLNSVQTIQETPSSEDIIRNAEERKRFDSISLVRKEAKRAFKELKNTEYRLLSTLRPQLLYTSLDEYQ